MKSLSVSSREGQASYLCDGSDQYWTGSGMKHWVRLEMHHNVLVTKLSMVSGQIDAKLKFLKDK